LATIGVTALTAGAAYAQSTPATPPAAPATAPAAPAAVTLNGPAMSVPLSLSSPPFSFDAGPLGKWYLSGALTGLGIVQSNPIASDNGGQADLSNGMIFVQKVDGTLQFFAAAGGYTFPTVGTGYVPVKDALSDYYGVVPVAYGKVVLNSSFSIEAGKLFTLIGYEGLFTYQNMNIERGLLWNQEPAVSRGAQVTYTSGAWTVNVSLNDGYYSNVYNWVDGSVAYAINSANTISFVGGGNLGHTATSAFATPVPQNNGSIYNIIYTYASGPWTVTPYLQINDVPSHAAYGYTKGGSEVGGALLANYNVNSNWSLSGRFEYLSSSGSPTDGTPNLTFYGAGSSAFSFTLTPTYQFNRFFVRPEVSVTSLSNITPGDGFGHDGTAKTQVRGLVEAGVLF
jgi:hypothetical protein